MAIHRPALVQVILAIFGLVVSCKKQTPEPGPVWNPDFAPAAPGMVWIYRMDSVVYRPGPESVDTVRSVFFLRERVTDSLPDGTFRLERSRGPSPEGPWQPVQAVRLQREAQRLIHTADNRALITLVSPPRAGTCWNPTAFLDTEQQVSVSGEPMQVFAHWRACLQDAPPPPELVEAFPSQAYILAVLADWDSAIERRFVRFWYGQDTGLLKAEWQILDSQCAYCCQGDLPACSELPWDTRAERGFRLTQTLITHF